MMNERIQELAKEATTKIRFRLDPNTYKHIDDLNSDLERVEFDKEKFAELIVRECLDIGYKAYLNDNSTFPVFPREQIKKHFGIE